MGIKKSWPCDLVFRVHRHASPPRSTFSFPWPPLLEEWHHPKNRKAEESFLGEKGAQQGLSDRHQVCLPRTVE